MKDEITRIKRVAQFLLDNATCIEQWLQESDDYRSLRVDLHIFKHYDPPKLEVELGIYDAKDEHHFLLEDSINLENLKELCKAVDKTLTANELVEAKK